ncbi:MAG: aldehyde dehydrogenase family protein [Candidatus Sungbacteria bacterium]|nr:aldehyde dehydrogenase family protein [Candidatus Sungbacteria bacterium]
MNTLHEFKNEPHLDWTNEENRNAMRNALQRVKGEFGKSYLIIIDGEWSLAKKSFYSFDPATCNPRINPHGFDPTRDIIGIAYTAGPNDIDRAVRVAEKIITEWRKLGVEKRAELLWRAAQIMRERKFELAAWLVYEVSKSWDEAISEVEEAIDFIELYVRESYFFFGEFPTASLKSEENILTAVPRGPTAAISTWNFPIALAVEKIAASLVCGCPVLFKPAEQAFVCGWMAVKCFLDAGVPPELIAYLPGGDEVGKALVTSRGIAQIAFTGSVEAGIAINLSAAQTPGKFGIKGFEPELGGNNAVIVCPSAVHDSAIRDILHSKFGFNGQKCSALQRLIFVGSPLDCTPRKICEGVIEAAKSLEYGHPENPAYRHTSLIDNDAYKKVLERIEALKCYANPCYEQMLKKVDRGYFVGPIIFDKIPPHLGFVQEEIFGPVLMIFYARSLEDAVLLANSTPNALTGGVFTELESEIEYAKQNIDVGNFYANRPITGAMVGRQPFGGFKFSGNGKKVGCPERLNFFLNQKTVTINRERYGALLK